MFKDNYIKKLAFDNVRKQKTFYKFLFGALVLIFGLSTMISILLPSYEKIGFRERYTRYGLWSVASENLSDEKLSLLKDNDGLQIGHIYNIGEITYQNKSIGSINSLDSSAVDLTTLSLVAGRVPKNNQEIMIAEEQFLALGIPKQINQDIELTISNDKTIVKKYKIVGIVKNFIHIYPISLSPYLTVGETSSDNIILLNAKDNLAFWNSTIQQELQSELQYNTTTYDGYSQRDSSGLYSYRDSTTMFRWFVLVLGFTGIIGTMASAMSKRTGNFALMKAIGATSVQIQKMIVYEGVFLIIVAGILGAILGLLASVGVLLFYCSQTDSELIFILSSLFYLQFALSAMIALIAIFIPTFQVNRIPLIGQIQHQVNNPKKRKIRKITVLTLAIQEFTQHKLISILLVGIVFMGVMGGELFTSSFTNYKTFIDGTQKDDKFDYRLGTNNQMLTTQDIQSLTSIENTTWQVVHQNPVYITWEGIEKEGTATEYRKIHGNTFAVLPQYSEWCDFSYYENEEMIKEIFDKGAMQGRLPKNDNEVVIYKPFMVYGSSSQGLSPSGKDKDNYAKDEGLKIGDHIYAFKTSAGREPTTKIEEPFEIVGIMIYEDEITSKESDLLFYEGYNFILNSQTYQKYFDRDIKQLLFFDLNNKEAMFPLKKTIYNLINENKDIRFEDQQAIQQEREISSLQFFLSTASFSGILFVGIVTLTYLYRKVKLLSQKHEMGLYRAIGMTNKQLYFIHAIYGVFIYLLAVSIYIGICINSYLKAEYSLVNALKEVVTPELFIFLTVLGVGFVFAIMLPVYSELKENILETISKN